MQATSLREEIFFLYSIARTNVNANGANPGIILSNYC